MTAVLRVDKLAKHYGNIHALSGLTFDLQDNEIIGLIGPNGAGKSTAINLISGAVPPTRGSVQFRGESVTGLPCHRLVRRGLVRTFQNINIFGSCTVAENVERGTFSTVYDGFWTSLYPTGALRARRAAAREKTRDILHRLGIDRYARSLATTLPYGHQKLVNLAIALAADPKLIMLDEPAAGLNDQEAERLMEVIRAVNRSGVSILIVDHNTRFIFTLCDRVVVLHHGEVLAIGKPKAVLENQSVVDAYLGRTDDAA